MYGMSLAHVLPDRLWVDHSRRPSGINILSCAQETKNEKRHRSGPYKVRAERPDKRTFTGPGAGEFEQPTGTASTRGQQVSNREVETKRLGGASAQSAFSAPFPAGYRAAGVLLHVTSLPSPYGIGDIGP